MSLFAKRNNKSSQLGIGKPICPDSHGNTVSDSSAPLSRRSEKMPKAAFTLVEVMVAMFISVIAVSSTYMLLTYSRDLLRSSSNRIEAFNNARGALEYLRTLEFDSSELNIGNHATTLNGQTFQYNIARYDSDDDLKQITVQSDWNSELSDAVRQVELMSVVSAPLHTE